MGEFKKTFRKGMGLSDIKKGDVVYVKKTTGGHSHFYEGVFVEFQKGLVLVEIIGAWDQDEKRWSSKHYLMRNWSGLHARVNKKNVMVFGGEHGCNWLDDMTPDGKMTSDQIVDEVFREFSWDGTKEENKVYSKMIKRAVALARGE